MSTVNDNVRRIGLHSTCVVVGGQGLLDGGEWSSASGCGGETRFRFPPEAGELRCDGGVEIHHWPTGRSRLPRDERWGVNGDDGCMVGG